MPIRQTRGKLVVLLHGLCMNDLLSKRKGLEAPLDRGNWGDMPLSTSAYCAPLARQDKIRSARILDLRFGNLVDDEWRTRGILSAASFGTTENPIRQGESDPA